VNMPPLRALGGVARSYCQNLSTLGVARITGFKSHVIGAPAPGAAAANLWAFLGSRLHDAWDLLGCGTLLPTANPVSVVLDAAGLPTDAVFGGLPTPAHS